MDAVSVMSRAANGPHEMETWMTNFSRLTKPVLLVLAIGVALPVMAHDRSGSQRGPDFSTLDTNGDGQITREEMQSRSAERFETADTNGDGLLTAQEMTARADAERSDRIERRVQRMIEELDANADGALSQAELLDRRAERLFERADQNEDGSISEDEFAQARDSMMRRSGKNGGPRSETSQN